jgi:hypothetical protein
MPINIVAAGAAGIHSFRAVSVNSDLDYIYFRDANIPNGITTGATYIYSSGVGAVSGVSDGTLV